MILLIKYIADWKSIPKKNLKIKLIMTTTKKTKFIIDPKYLSRERTVMINNQYCNYETPCKGSYRKTKRGIMEHTS